MPLNILKLRDESARGIRSKANKGFHDCTSCGFSSRAERFPDDDEMEGSRLKDAMPNDFAKGFFACSVKNISDWWRASKDIFAKAR
jgi:hypothetical protein